ncbi:MAG: hypothetical protein J3R72DRAFT_89081 [Linnemannia gamsii]|nr:MAG: hypothetical protein J3R72DRAFT_89081 [Linnemannia gamsii]
MQGRTKGEEGREEKKGKKGGKDKKGSGKEREEKKTQQIITRQIIRVVSQFNRAWFSRVKRKRKRSLVLPSCSQLTHSSSSPRLWRSSQPKQTRKVGNNEPAFPTTLLLAITFLVGQIKTADTFFFFFFLTTPSSPPFLFTLILVRTGQPPQIHIKGSKGKRKREIEMDK